MKKTLVSKGAMFVIDADKDIVKRVDRQSLYIDSIFVMPESDDIYVQPDNDKDDAKKIHADKGDIVIAFYSDDYPHRCIVIKSKEWAENIDAKKAADQKRKEEWAAKEAGAFRPANDPDLGDKSYE